MSLLKKLAGLAVGAAAVGAVAYVLQNREHHDDEYEHIWGPEDEVEPETDSAEPTRQAEISYAVFCLKKKKYPQFGFIETVSITRHRTIALVQLPGGSLRTDVISLGRNAGAFVINRGK